MAIFRDETQVWKSFNLLQRIQKRFTTNNFIKILKNFAAKEVFNHIFHENSNCGQYFHTFEQISINVSNILRRINSF